MRILHIPVVAGRQAWGLSRAERRAGHQSDFIAFEQTFGQLPTDGVLFDSTDGIFRRELKRWSFFLKSLFRYDVFHFHFGQKFFVLYPRALKNGDSIPAALLRLLYGTYSLLASHLDVLLIRLLGKKMFMTFHGDDIRQGDRSLDLYRHSIAQEVGPDYYDSYSDKRKRRMGAFYQRHCRALYVVSPDLLAMAPAGAKLIHYTGIDSQEWDVPANAHPNPRPLVVHAPTNRLVKGTRFIEKAVESLRSKGVDFDFILVEKMTNAEAKAIYEKADLIVDQLMAGWYGVFAVELMMMGKPVIAYIRPEDLAQEPESFQTELPIIRASPESIEDVLEKALQNHIALPTIGSRSRAFAKKWYDADKIAANVLADYNTL